MSSCDGLIVCCSCTTLSPLNQRDQTVAQVAVAQEKGATGSTIHVFLKLLSDLPSPPNFFLMENVPKLIKGLYKAEDEDMTESAKRYYANCTWFDDGVGELITYLKEVGEFENTLFIYVNDNGWEQTPDQEFWDDPMRSHNGGDKGKISLFDQSFRTPIIFSWDGEIEKNVHLNYLMHSSDIPATILDYLGIEIPKNFYGKSYKTAIDGDTFSGREEIIGNITTTRSFEDMMGKPTEGYWIRDKEWFLNWNITEDHIGLFDMKNDQNNDVNLASEKPERVNTMIGKIKEWKDEINGVLR